MDILADEAVEHKAPPNRAARRAAASADRRASWSINEWCAEAGIGRVKCYEEMKRGRIRAKKCGSRTLIVTSPKAWLASLPDMVAA